MTRLNVTDARCEALFASGLQRSDALTPQALAELISRTVQRFGIAGCLTGARLFLLAVQIRKFELRPSLSYGVARSLPHMPE
jgi:hypothetical protein